MWSPLMSYQMLSAIINQQNQKLVLPWGGTDTHSSEGTSLFFHGNYSSRFGQYGQGSGLIRAYIFLLSDKWDATVYRQPSLNQLAANKS